ncbi:MAG: GNAT family N-acetyltransferase [Anaerolineales bacterium]
MSRTVSPALTNEFEILTATRVDEVGEEAWDRLSAGRPFQSARWYRYGERVMADCPSVYIILSRNAQPVARATFWLVRAEPLPVSNFVRSLIYPVLRRWPLLICRSPLSNSSGLILPEGPDREKALRVIAGAAYQELRRLGGSFVLFDYLYDDQTKWAGWPAGFKPMGVTGPGTRLALQWKSFNDYLRSNPKFRIHQHFRRSSQEAADLGIRVTRHINFDAEFATTLELIHNVERKHDSSPNPWAAGMLEYMQMVESTWLTAHIRDRLVGCMLLLVDNGVQIACLPGLTEDVPFAYFMLLYEAIQDAIAKDLTALHWGSGAYETKRRLGFELEYTNNFVYRGNGLIPGLIARLAGS